MKIMIKLNIYKTMNTKVPTMKIAMKLLIVEYRNTACSQCIEMVGEGK